MVAEELGEAAEAFNELVAADEEDVPDHAYNLSCELVQTAATCMGWIEAIAMQFGITPIAVVKIPDLENDE